MNGAEGESYDNIEKFFFVDRQILDQLEGIKLLSAHFAMEPNHERGADIGDAVNAHLESVGLAMHQLDDGSESPQNVDTLLYYIERLEEKRVEFLTELTGGDPEAFEIDKEVFGKAREQLLEGVPEGTTISDHLPYWYAERMKHDFDKFDNIISAQFYNSPAERQKRFLKQFGRQALDVAKVSLGVVVGIGVAKKLRFMK